MATISGRYGSVQRLFKREVNDGVTTWSTVDTSATNDRFTTPSDPAKLVEDPKTGSLVGGGGSTVSSVTSWSMENTIAPIDYIASNTRGYRGQLCGLHSASGQINGLGGCPPIAPGERFKFLGYVGPENGILNDLDGHVYQITALATTVGINIDYGLTQPITWSVSWTSDWQQPGDELAHNKYAIGYDPDSDTVQWNTEIAPDLWGFWDYTPIPCETLLPSTKVNLEIYKEDDSEILKGVCLTNADIQFQTDSQTYANSCSAKAGGWQSAVVGATSCTLNTTIHGSHYDLMNEAGLPGSNHRVKIYVSGDTAGVIQKEDFAYWDFYKMMFTTFGGLNVDMTSAAPLSFSCQMNFNAFPGCQAGYIAYKQPVGDGGQVIPFVDLRPEGSSRTYD